MREGNLEKPVLLTAPVKDPDKRIKEIFEEEAAIREKIEALEAQKRELLKTLQEDIGEEGTQDVLRKLWKQKHKNDSKKEKAKPKEEEEEKPNEEKK